MFAFVGGFWGGFLSLVDCVVWLVLLSGCGFSLRVIWIY